MNIFPGQGKVGEVWFESGKLAKNGESPGKVRELGNFIFFFFFFFFFFQNLRWLCYGSLLNFQKLINLQNFLHSFVK